MSKVDIKLISVQNLDEEKIEAKDPLAIRFYYGNQWIDVWGNVVDGNLFVHVTADGRISINPSSSNSVDVTRREI